VGKRFVELLVPLDRDFRQLVQLQDVMSCSKARNMRYRRSKCITIQVEQCRAGMPRRETAARLPLHHASLTTSCHR
jgi:hypothetical protein